MSDQYRLILSKWIQTSLAGDAAESKYTFDFETQSNVFNETRIYKLVGLESLERGLVRFIFRCHEDNWKFIELNLPRLHDLLQNNYFYYGIARFNQFMEGQ